jgi:hypothetical protein
MMRLNIFILILATIGLLSCSFALLIDRFLIIKKYFLYLTIVLAAIVIGILFSIYLSHLNGNEKKDYYKIGQKILKQDISVDYALDIVEMSGLLAYEGKYHGGILRQYDFIDLKCVLPEFKEHYSMSGFILWAYELDITSILREGNIIRVTGNNGKSKTLYFSFVESHILCDASSIFFDAVEEEQ